MDISCLQSWRKSEVLVYDVLIMGHCCIMCWKNCYIWSAVIFFRTSPSSYREEEKSQGVVWLWTRKWGWTENRSGRHCGNHQTGKEIPLIKVHRDLIHDFKKMAMILKKFKYFFENYVILTARCNRCTIQANVCRKEWNLTMFTKLYIWCMYEGGYCWIIL